MKGVQLVFAAGTLLLGLCAQAEVSEAEFADLKARYAELAEKVDGMSGTGWADRIGITGDFRFRYENIDEEGTDEYDRVRIRARVEINARMPNDVEVGFGLATGGENPVSANVSLGSGGARKGIDLDLAYASWTGIENTVLAIGKFRNPLVRPGGNGLLWDGDYRPEGLMAGWDDGEFFATALGSWLEGDSRNGTEFFWGVQGGWRADLNGTSVMLGASYFDIGIAGAGSFFGDVDDFYGNSFTCTNPVTPAGCTYDLNYEEIEVFAEVDTRIGGLPVTLFADYVQNYDASVQDTGWAAGVRVGRASAAGQWEAGYFYQDIEADAWFGLVNDSDFGDGGTDVKGHALAAGYALNEWVVLRVTYFINEIDSAAGNTHDYDRLRLDLQFAFR